MRVCECETQNAVWPYRQRIGRVCFLLGLEERDGEVLVELLVGEIDEELFERILLKVFEAINVENAENARVGRLGALIHQARVDLLHDPVEQLGVDSLGQRVARVLRLVRLERDLRGGETRVAKAQRRGERGGAQRGGERGALAAACEANEGSGR
eukprot:5936337-Pleurochrysis_carterae.AAC.2